jgi:ABC-type polysaccharide/polyol phosphate transport system ATPase subunit
VAGGNPAEESVTVAQAAPPSVSRVADRPVAIEVRDLSKTFWIPKQRIDSFKERAVHPFRSQEHRELRALRGISFDVHNGEFFGIVGRNGSGKSTLLKILASIYRADAGTIRMAGRPAPFIELGVGFNHELTARENVVLNGVMMGLSQREAASRLDSVIDFAELHDFVDLKLKNYSSGMMVRLAFSVMLEAKADILLIDEVLAVGDAAFQQKCADAFHEMRDEGRTIVLVTHDMGSVEKYCDRAMLIHDGDRVSLGEPEDVAREYLRLNFQDQRPTGAAGQLPDRNSRLVDAWIENASGERITNLEVGETIRLNAVLEAIDELPYPFFGIHVRNADGINLFAINQTLSVPDGEPNYVAPGARVRISATIENLLTPGRYFVSCWVVRGRESGQVALQAIEALDFVVFGMAGSVGLVRIPGEVEVVAYDPDSE